MAPDPGELWSYESELTAFAQFLCHHREDGEDVAHTALLKAAEHIGGFRGESSMRTWLHAIVTNECRMLHRRSPSLSLDQIADHDPAWASLVANGLCSPPDPTAAAAQGELRGLALSTLRDMPPHYRTALFLQLALHLSVEEIADALDRSVPATKAILYRARQSMRRGVAQNLGRDA